MSDLFGNTRYNPKSLRPYQITALDKCVEKIDEGLNPLLILPTGTGKTIVFAEVVKHYYYQDKKSLVLAHRDELINQAIDKIEIQTGLFCGKEKAEEHASMEEDVVIGSVQTMKNSRLENLKKGLFDLLIIDECHHSTAKTYKAIIDHFCDANTFGVTATPDRADQKELSEIFNVIAYQYLMVDAIKDGFLCNLKGFRVKDFVIDLSELRTRYGDFVAGDLDKVVKDYIYPMAKAIKEQSENNHTLIFLPSVASSQLLSDALNEYGVKSGFLSGTTSSDERAKTLMKFNRREITHLCNCDLFTEGYDCPSIDCIVMASPMKSRSKYAQRVGRGTRIFPGKEFLKLVEFTYNYKKHSLVNAYELFTGKGYEQKIRDRAEMYEDNINGTDFLSSLEKSHMEYYNFNRVMKELVVTEHGFEEYNPFELANLEEIDLTGELNITWNGYKLRGAITDKQLKVLKRFKIHDAEFLSKAQASCMIDLIAKNDWRVNNLIRKARNNFEQKRLEF